jgi:hypothetical protein
MENAKELNRRVFQRWIGSRQEILKDTSGRSQNTPDDLEKVTATPLAAEARHQEDQPRRLRK